MSRHLVSKLAGHSGDENRHEEYEDPVGEATFGQVQSSSLGRLPTTPPLADFIITLTLQLQPYRFF